MATYNKFEVFVEDLLSGVHNFTAAGDAFEVYLSNATPSASGDSVKADLAEISTGNGYTGAVDIANDVSRTGGTASVTATDVTITATGAVGPFRYVAVFNETATDDPLVCWWDYGSSISLANGETFTIDFGSSVFTLA
jgi:hypothetical protein